MKPSDDLRFGFNIIGYVSGNLGIGVTTRQVAHALRERGHRLSVWDLDPGLGRMGADRSFDSLRVDTPQDLPYGINLVILPPPEVQTLLRSDCLGVLLDPRRLNAIFSMWELTVIPPAARSALDFFDVAIGESEFVRACFERELSGVRVLGAYHPLDLPKVPVVSRARFGIPEDDVVFFSAFDVQSDPVRKNPLAIVDAFEKAGLARPGYSLVIKIVNADVPDRTHPTIRKLVGRAGRSPQIRILSEALDYPTMLSLHAACDVYVSLHRSEGLGLCLMEAMALGKPTIATDWSGNMSFMNHHNACLVGHDLVPVQDAVWQYSEAARSRHAVWAEPRVDEAAAWMATLASDPDLRAEKGRRALADMAHYSRRGARMYFIDDLLHAYDRHDPSDAAIHRCAALERLHESPLDRPSWIQIFARSAHRRLGSIASRGR